MGEKDLTPLCNSVAPDEYNKENKRPSNGKENKRPSNGKIEFEYKTHIRVSEF